MKNRFEYILFVLFSYFFRIIGLNLSRRTAPILAFLFFYFIPIRKKVVFENLKLAFPSKDLTYYKKLAFKIYKSFAITIIEIMCLRFLSKSQMINVVRCSNPELIIEKYNQGKGVILLSSHFGNWEFVAISVAMQIQLAFSVVVKTMRNNLVFDWINKGRTKYGNEIVPLGISIRKTYQTLKQKKIVAMVADQRGPKEGAKVNFFGKKTAVYTGPAALALKTEAPIICGIPIRDENYKYNTLLVEIPTDNLPEDEEGKVIEICQIYTSYLEKVIRENPEQWLWMHKRWKY